MNQTLQKLFLITILIFLPGCQVMGLFASSTGMIDKPKKKAEYNLSGQMLLVLVDDEEELLPSGRGRYDMTEDINTALLSTKLQMQVVSASQVSQVRNNDPKFDERSISELGELFQADRILWVQVRDVFVPPQLDDLTELTRIIVRVKVFDPKAPAKAEMRLWPGSPDGEFVSVEKPIKHFRTDKRDQISRLLVAEAADTVTKLFYAHEVQASEEANQLSAR